MNQKLEQKLQGSDAEPVSETLVDKVEQVQKPIQIIDELYKDYIGDPQEISSTSRVRTGEDDSSNYQYVVQPEDDQ